MVLTGNNPRMMVRWIDNQDKTKDVEIGIKHQTDKTLPVQFAMAYP